MPDAGPDRAPVPNCLPGRRSARLCIVEPAEGAATLRGRLLRWVGMDLHEELRRLVELLEQEAVDYALCGGLAVAFHGYARFTRDIDLIVLREDVDRITGLVRTLGFVVSTGPMPFGVGTEHPREVHRISKLGDGEVLSLDLVVVTPALEPVWNDREVFEWQGRRIKVVSAEGLATMKRLAGRDQDLLDLKMLGFERDEDAQDDET